MLRHHKYCDARGNRECPALRPGDVAAARGRHIAIIAIYGDGLCAEGCAQDCMSAAAGLNFYSS